ncbi:Hypothetical protein R9X50_00337200 [Acrodontium crateriforme]|uniref:N-acetyltransferase domain-containing protein n=1 Tax=Acrodontium crateriforme TaxID=150365 RepID=A0AAQ3M3H0_9PEZI|nr:Hypothetical protein R9X50_00337200 [Acrodontium crateriforme]
MENPGTRTSLPKPPLRTLTTPRLRLRTLTTNDAEASMRLLTREDVMRWTSREKVETLEQCTRWLEDRTLGKECFNFAIELRGVDGTTGEEGCSGLIGMVGSFQFPGLGYMIHPDYAGKGYATEAVKAIIPALWDHMPCASDDGIGYDYLEGLTDTENYASQNILRKCGFTYCETREQDFYNPTLKQQRDTAFYRLARPGKDLEKLGLLPLKESSEADEPGFVPPIQ